MYFTKDFIRSRASGEVYETMDFIEHLESSTASAPKRRLLEGRLTNVDLFEIVLADSAGLKNTLSSIKVLKLPDLAAAIKNKPKVAPIVKAPLVKPKLLNKSKAPYPVNGGGLVGNVIVCVLVGIDGRPEYVSTAGSSGSPVLDGAALEHCIKFRFTPAQDEHGNKVRCLVYIPMEVSP